MNNKTVCALLLISLPLFSIRFPWSKKPSAPIVPAAQQQPINVHKEINQLIERIEQLKKENAQLKSGGAYDSLKTVDQQKKFDIVTDVLKDIGEVEDSRQQEIDELKKQVEYLGNGWVNTLKTFEANIKSPLFSDLLSKSLEKLDDAKIAQKINEEMANSLYRLKFMYAETRYTLGWMNERVNWSAASQKNIFKPEFTKSFTDDQIKKIVMAVEVK